MEKDSRRVSPALVISIIALVFALGGSALAAKRYLITNTQQISPAVLKKIAKMSATQEGPAGPAGAAGSPGAAGAAGAQGVPGPGAVVYWAVVDEEGAVKRHGSGEVTVEHIAKGTYVVNFDEDVNDCAYEAAIGRSDYQDTEDPGFATVVARFEQPQGVLVQTYNDQGDGVDKGFHLAVFC